MNHDEMDPALKLMRLVAEIRLILGIEVITRKHITLGRELIAEVVKLIPVSLA